MQSVTVIAAAAVVVVAVMPTPAAVAVAGWMCERALQTQEADVGRQMESEMADQTFVVLGHAPHAQRAQQAELQGMQVE